MSLTIHPTLHPIVRRQTIADALRRTAIRLPAKTGIVCGATQWTYAEFDALVTRLAVGLAQMGVAEGDKVAVLARHSGIAVAAPPAGSTVYRISPCPAPVIDEE